MTVTGTMGVSSLAVSCLLLLACGSGTSASRSREAPVSPAPPAHGETSAVLVWDTVKPLAKGAGVADRRRWRPVANVRPKGFSPRGDLLVETAHLAALIPSRGGRVSVWPRRRDEPTNTVTLATRPEATVSACRVVAHTSASTSVEVTFRRHPGDEPAAVLFVFADGPGVEVRHARGAGQISIHGAVDHAVVPDVVAGDLLFSPAGFEADRSLLLPTRHLLVALLGGGDAMLVLTWPGEHRQARLIGQDGQTFERIDLDRADESLFVSFVAAPRVWHEEALTAEFLERDVAIDWHRPYPASWRTQLSEDGVATTYPFGTRRLKSFWRGGVGTYTYPVWFDGERAIYHLGKKVPPAGVSVVYFLARSGATPDSVAAPMDIVRQTLGADIYWKLLDTGGTEQTSDTRPGHCVGSATCGVTDKLKPIFEAGEEVVRRDYVEGGTQDMVFHLLVLLDRAREYQTFADSMLAYLRRARESGEAPEPFLDEVEGATGEMISAYERHAENLGSREWADQLRARTTALTRQRRPENQPMFAELTQQWRAMGGALEAVNRELHTRARNLYRTAGYGAALQPAAAGVAAEILRRTRAQLRNPNQYEWGIEAAVAP